LRRAAHRGRGHRALRGRGPPGRRPRRARRSARDRRRGRLPGRPGRPCGDPRTAGHPAGRALGAVRIQTERLVLRPCAPGDFDAMLGMQSDTEVARYLYWDPRTAAEVREILARKSAYTALRVPGDDLVFAVELASTGEVVGDCGMHWNDDEHRQGEIG